MAPQSLGIPILHCVLVGTTDSEWMGCFLWNQQGNWVKAAHRHLPLRRTCHRGASEISALTDTEWMSGGDHPSVSGKI